MRRFRKKGFSILEVLVGISIIGLLISLVLPALQMARESARRNRCQDNLRGQGIALHQFEQSKRHFPSGGEGLDTTANPPAVVFEIQSLYVQLFPFIDDESYVAGGVSAQYVYNDAACPANQALAKRTLPELLCPTQIFNGIDPDGYGITNYGPAVYVDIDPSTGLVNPASRKAGALRLGGTVAATITDGLSRTIAIAEDSGRGSEFVNPIMLSQYADPIYTNGTAIVWDGKRQVTYNQWCSQNNLASKGLPPGDSLPPSMKRVFNRWAEPASASGISGQANSSALKPVRPVNGNWKPIGGPPDCAWNATNCGPNEEIFGWHIKGANVLMCDGHVRLLGDECDPRILRMMITADELEIYDDHAVP